MAQVYLPDGDVRSFEGGARTIHVEKAWVEEEEGGGGGEVPEGNTISLRGTEVHYSADVQLSGFEFGISSAKFGIADDLAGEGTSANCGLESASLVPDVPSRATHAVHYLSRAPFPRPMHFISDLTPLCVAQVPSFTLEVDTALGKVTGSRGGDASSDLIPAGTFSGHTERRVHTVPLLAVHC